MTVLPHAGPFTRADLDAMPDDGHRHELIDGVLVVSPAPSPLHQRVVVRLTRLLVDACPTDLEVLTAPLDVVLADDTIVQPDILVGRRAEFTDRDLPAAPVLAVEILSPSTRRFDLMLKHSRFEAAGVASYWVVDPIEASLRAWDLVDGSFAEVGNVGAGTIWSARLPYPVAFDPAQLVSEY